MTNEKIKAYQILNLEENASELEVKKAYRKLSLRYHPENKKNNNSEASKYEEIQVAYAVLSAEWPTNKEYFTFSEQELQDFEREEIKDICLYNNDKSFLSYVQSIKNALNRDGLNINKEEMLRYSPSEKVQVFKNWFNLLYLRYGLGQYGEIRSLEKSFRDIHLTSSKKKIWEGMKRNFGDSFSDSEWEGYLEEFREEEDINILSFFANKLLKEEIKKMVSEKMEESSNPELLTDIINVEASMYFDAPPYEKGEDYWINWINIGNKWEIETKKKVIIEVLNRFNNEEELAKEAANRYYEVLGLPEEATLRQVKVKFRELSSILHPDKGGDGEKFKLINDAHGVLGDEIKKKRYDLCLLWDKDDTYLNRKKLGKIKKSQELVNEEFGRDIELILRDELEVNDLIWEDLIDYGEEFWREKGCSKLWVRKGTKKELVKPQGFYQSVLLGNHQYEAIELTRKYLEIIEDVNMILKKTKARIAESGKGKSNFVKNTEGLLSEEEPTLIREELDEPGEINCIIKIERMEVRIFMAKDDKEDDKLRKQKNGLYKETLERVQGIRDAKRKLLKEVDEKTKEGNDLLGSLNDKEAIAKFLTEFSNFLDSLRERGDYQEEVGVMVEGHIERRKITISHEVIKQVLNQKEKETGLLKERLESFLKGEVIENEEEAEEETENYNVNDYSNSKPITNEEKKVIVEYLDEVVFKAFFGDKSVDQNKNNLQSARNNIIQNYENSAGTKDYSLGISEVVSKEKAEDIRAKIVDEVAYFYKENKKQNDKAFELLVNFSKIIQKEIEEELGNSLTSGQQGLLTIVGEKNNSAKKLTTSKRKILSSLPVVEGEEVEENNFQEEAERLKRRLEEEKKQREVDYDALLAKIKVATTIDELNSLTGLINNFDYASLSVGKSKDALLKAQSLCRVELIRVEVIEKVETEWNSNPVEGKDLVDALNDVGWKNRIQSQFKEVEINKLRDNYLGLIARAREELKVEQEKRKNEEKLKEILASLEKISDSKELGNTFQEVKKNALYRDNKQQIDNVYRFRALIEFNKILVVIQKSNDIEELNNLNTHIDYLDGEAFPKKSELTGARTIRIIILNTIKSVDKYWEVTGIKNKAQTEVLGKNWTTNFNDKTGEEIIEQGERFKKMIDDDTKLVEQQEVWQSEVIANIQQHWGENAVITGNKINAQTINEILGNNWQSEIRKIVSEVDIKNKKKNFIEKINNARKVDIDLQNSAIIDVNEYWNSNRIKEKINGKSKEEVLNFGLVSAFSWEKDIIKQSGIVYITAKKDYYKGLIDEVKEQENSKRKKKTNFSGEDSLNKDLEKLREGKRTNASRSLFHVSLGGFDEDVEDWFKKLVELLKDNHQFLKNVCGEVSGGRREKIISELEKEKLSVKEEESFKSRFSKITKVRQYLWEIDKSIYISESKKFLEKALKITGLKINELSLTSRDCIEKLCQGENKKQIVNLRGLVFIDIVEKGIEKELTHENTVVPCGELETKWKESILQKTDFEDKLNALQSVLKEVKVKRQEIVAENTIQALIDKEILSDNYEELKNDLENLRKSIKQNSFNNNEYQKKINQVDKKELELMRASALLRDDEGRFWKENNLCNLTDKERKVFSQATKTNIRQEQKKIRLARKERWDEAWKEVQNSFRVFNETISETDQKKITDAFEELKKLHYEGDEIGFAWTSFLNNSPENKNWKKKKEIRINELEEEIAKWEEIGKDIKGEMNLGNLTDNGEWDKKIQALNEKNLPSHKRKTGLKNKLENRRKMLADYENLIKEINSADTWEKLKESYITALDKGKEIKERIENAYKSKIPQKLIERAWEIISKDIGRCDNGDKVNNELNNQVKELKKDLKNYKLTLPDGKGISELENLLGIQKEKIVFRKRFRTQIGGFIDSDTIDAYRDKKLTPEIVADAYKVGILAGDISNEGQVKIANKTYKLQEKDELEKAKKAKIFLRDFNNLGNNFSPKPTDEKILDYCEANLSAKQAFNAWRQGWHELGKIQLGDNNIKQINLGDGWEDYDWEKESFAKANYRHIFFQGKHKLEKKRNLPAKKEEVDKWKDKYKDPEKAWIAYNNYWNFADVGDYDNSSQKRKITWDGGTSWETGFDPLTDNKFNAYTTAFSSSWNSAIVGADLTKQWGDILVWLKENNYPPKEAKIVLQNGWDASDVLDWKVRQRAATVKSGADNYSHNPLLRTKFQAQDIQKVNDYWDSVMVGLSIDKNDTLGVNWENKLVVKLDYVNDVAESLIEKIKEKKEQIQEQARKAARERQEREEKEKGRQSHKGEETQFKRSSENDNGQPTGAYQENSPATSSPQVESKLTEEELDNFFEKAKTGTLEEKFSALEEIEKNQGEENLEKRKDKEREIRESLIREDFERYKQRAIDRVEKEKKKWNISKDDIKDILKTEEETVDRIYQKGNSKKLEEIIKSSEQILKISRSGRDEMERKKTQLLEFKNSSNIYKKGAYEENRKKVDEVLKNLSLKLEDYSVQVGSVPSESIPWNYILLVGGLIIAGLVATLVIRKKSKTKNRKKNSF